MRVWGWAVASLVLATAAWADEPKVKVQADVVFASTAAGAVEPSLAKMQQAMAAKVKYATMKTLEAKQLELSVGKAQALKLPNQKTAELLLQAMKANVATVKVTLPPAEAVYSLGRDKALYLQGGAHDGGDLWLVLSQPK